MAIPWKKPRLVWIYRCHRHCPRISTRPPQAHSLGTPRPRCRPAMGLGPHLPGMGVQHCWPAASQARGLVAVRPPLPSAGLARRWLVASQERGEAADGPPLPGAAVGSCPGAPSSGGEPLACSSSAGPVPLPPGVAVGSCRPAASEARRSPGPGTPPSNRCARTAPALHLPAARI